VNDGRLTIEAARSEKAASKDRSEFAYGSFVRSFSLPPGADEDDITATYDRNILTVSVGLSQPKPSQKAHRRALAELNTYGLDSHSSRVPRPS